MSDTNFILHNTHDRFTSLMASVDQILKAGAGDPVRIRAQMRDLVAFEASLEPVKHIFLSGEILIMQRSLQRCKSLLTEAISHCSDPPEFPSLLRPDPLAEGSAHRGPGRPRAYIDTMVLRQLTITGYSASRIAKLAQVTPKTIRNRQVELGLRRPGPVPIRRTVGADGSVKYTQVHRTFPRMSSITDEDLDVRVRLILQDHPNWGRVMIKGALEGEGHRVPRRRIEASYLREHGPPNRFGRRDIVRGRYHVAGANSCWHLDGNHNLVKYKMVLHAFIDGKSRVVTAIGMHSNNRSGTVLKLFLGAIPVWGVPIKLRGDHGVENVKVAQWMVLYRGRKKGAFLWGKSTRNTRIERLWNDTREAFCAKWLRFFIDLEEHHGLDRDNETHLWLLHHLFLNSINLDAQSFKEAWNRHKISIKGGRNAAPHDLWLESQLRDGIRGFRKDKEFPVLGPEWEAGTAERDYESLGRASANEAGDDQFPKTRLSHVDFTPPEANWTPEAIARFDRSLNLEARLQNTMLTNRTLIWVDALTALPRLGQM